MRIENVWITGCKDVEDCCLIKAKEFVEMVITGDAKIGPAGPDPESPYTWILWRLEVYQNLRQ